MKKSLLLALFIITFFITPYIDQLYMLDYYLIKWQVEELKQENAELKQDCTELYIIKDECVKMAAECESQNNNFKWFVTNWVLLPEQSKRTMIKQYDRNIGGE